jgi:chromosome segregation ATPase
MDGASEIIRLHEMYQTLELKLGQEHKQNESLQRSVAELRDQLDESAMEKEVLERQADLLKDALGEKAKHISAQDFTLVEAQKQMQRLAASITERGQVISALYQYIQSPEQQEELCDQGREKKRKVGDTGL